MDVKNPDKWWKSKDHRRIPGARGQRFASLKTHLLYVAGVVAVHQYIVQGGAEHVYRAPDPPVEAPPPLPTSFGYSIAAEMPYLKLMETEKTIPEHVPQKVSLSAVKLREGVRTPDHR